VPLVAGGGSQIEAGLRTFANTVQAKLSALAAGEPEEQLRAPTEALFQAAGAALGQSVIAKGETLLPGRLGKPDYAVLVGGALTGYVELKAVGRGADPNAFTGRNREQWPASRACRISFTRTETSGRSIGMASASGGASGSLVTLRRMAREPWMPRQRTISRTS
jgi:hypothetical protein